MLYIISRDGKVLSDFLSHHESISQYKRVRTVKDLDGANKDDTYIVLHPLPYSFHWKIRPFLIINNLKNVTRYYTQKLINF